MIAFFGPWYICCLFLTRVLLLTPLSYDDPPSFSGSNRPGSEKNLWSSGYDAYPLLYCLGPIVVCVFGGDVVSALGSNLLGMSGASLSPSPPSSFALLSLLIEEFRLSLSSGDSIG